MTKIVSLTSFVNKVYEIKMQELLADFVHRKCITITNIAGMMRKPHRLFYSYGRNIYILILNSKQYLIALSIMMKKYFNFFFRG